MILYFYQQQMFLSFLPSKEQSHEGSELVIIPFRIPAAQPTPDFTEIAPGWQFSAHAPHSIQSSISMIQAFFWLISKTL
jgi:hypothetical protein